MPGNPREMITTAERSFPVRVRIAVPPGGFGQQYAQMTHWLDANCGPDGWGMTRSGTRGVLCSTSKSDAARRATPSQGSLQHSR
jgi:hypothetical protein